MEHQIGDAVRVLTEDGRGWGTTPYGILIDEIDPRDLPAMSRQVSRGDTWFVFEGADGFIGYVPSTVLRPNDRHSEAGTDSDDQPECCVCAQSFPWDGKCGCDCHVVEPDFYLG